MSQLTDAERAAIGHQAKGELSQTERAFEGLRIILLDEIEKSAPSEAERRERAYLQLNLLKRVRAALIAASANADIEEQRRLLTESGSITAG